MSGEGHPSALCMFTNLTHGWMDMLARDACEDPDRAVIIQIVGEAQANPD